MLSVEEVPAHAPVYGHRVDGVVRCEEHPARTGIDVVDADVDAAALDVQVSEGVDDGKNPEVPCCYLPGVGR